MQIWSVWPQGRRNAPKQVQQIFDLWGQSNLSAEFAILEKIEVESILIKMDVDQSQMTPQFKADLARTYLLAKHGGT